MPAQKNTKSNYQIFFTKSVNKYFENSIPKIQRQLNKHLDEIENDPYKGYPLHGNWAGFWAIECGTFRIIYEIIKDKKVINVIRIGPRKDVYRKS